MNNYMDSARTFYRSIPFISRALQTNVEGKYPPLLDENITSDRGAFFMVVTSANFAFIPTLSNLVLPYVISANSSMAFTAVTAFSTPFVIAVGIVALGILGYKLDQLLTYRAATHAAINEFTNFGSPSNSAFNWLLSDIGNIKKLLRNKNVDLGKRDHNNFTLLGRAAPKDIEIFSLLWDRASEKDQAEVFIICKNNQRLTKHSEAMNFLLDNHKICPKKFTEEEHHTVLNWGRDNWTGDHFIWLKKMIDLGFSFDAKGVTGKSIREELSKDILNFAFDHENRNMYYERKVLKKMNFLQFLNEPKISAVLTEEHKNENSFLNKLPLELIQEISKEVKKSFAPKLVYHENQLHAIAPFLEISEDSLEKLAMHDNVKIGNIIWDKISKIERVNLFIDCFFCRKNPILALSLMESKKVSATMFTEPEQFTIFKSMFTNFKEIGVYPECLDKLIDLGFNMNSGNGNGQTIREVIETNYLNNQDINEEQKIYYTKAIELIDKAFKRQMINFGLIIKPGLTDEGSNLSMFPNNDILSHILQTLSHTY